jgi:hypothetical protein
MMVLRKSRILKAQSYAISSIFRYFTCTKLLGSSSKLRTSDSTVAWFVVEQSEHMSEEEGEKRGRKCLLTKPESKGKSRQENLRGGSVGTKCKRGLAGDGPSQRRWQRDAAPERRINSLKFGQVRYDGCIDNKGVRGAVSKMVNRPNKKWNPGIERGRSEAKGNKEKRTNERDGSK